MTRAVVLSAMMLVLAGAKATFAQPLPPEKPDTNINKLLDANIIATHAYQIRLAQRPNVKANAECFAPGSLSDQQLQALVDHQKALLATPPQEIKAWATGQDSKFNPATDLQPILDSQLKVTEPRLPVNAMAAWWKEKAPKATDLQIKALAGIFQMMLDVDRDGDVLQNMFQLYQALGLPIHPGQIGIAAGSDGEFLAFGQEISPKLCACAFPTDSKTLEMMFRKLHNWGCRYTGERDKTVLARELLAEPEIKALIPMMEKAPAQKIAVIGHSFTMGVHWASPSAFVPVVSEMFKIVNPKVEIRQWEAGGLSASRAYGREKFYEQALAWKPDRVLLVVADNGPDNEQALKAMVDGFTATGIEVMVFDRLRTSSRPRSATAPAPALPAGLGVTPLSPTGAHVIEVGQLLLASPDVSKFVALDGIHMTEPWHRLMAKEWLKYLIGARTAKLEQ